MRKVFLNHAYAGVFNCVCVVVGKEKYSPGVDTIFFDQKKNVYNVVSYFTTPSNVFWEMALEETFLV